MKQPLDQLSWEKFFEVSKKNKSSPNTVESFNRLITYSKNFFIIAGYGAFTKGYVLIISKKFIPSYGLIERREEEELNFLINETKKIIQNELNRKSVIFEHGMCACIGGLDRAHLHIMSISNDSNKKSLKKAIKDTLYSRKAGIKHILFNGFKLENIHDINQIYESLNPKNESKEIKIVGKIYNLNDIQNLDQTNWPKVTLKHIMKGGHYVFFRSDYKDASFLTTNNFQTQFGREVVFNNELNLDKNFLKEKKKNKFNKELWRWQNSFFEKNIIETMKIFKKGFKKLEKMNAVKYSKFGIKICK